jgi:hypothetical protein
MPKPRKRRPQRRRRMSQLRRVRRKLTLLQNLQRMTKRKKAASSPVTEEPEESSEFTPKEMSKIQDDAFEIMEKELEITFNKIINKAGFLVKLNIPQGFK